MVYIARLLRKYRSEISSKKMMHDDGSTLLIFIIVLTTIVLSVDYALVLKFMDIIKKL